MNQSSVQCEILQFLQRYCAHIFIGEIVVSNRDIQALWRIGPLNLLYLFHQLETSYAICFTPEEIDGEEIYTLDGLVETVVRKYRA